MVDSTEFTALQNLVADMFVELTSLKGMVNGDASNQANQHRQLWHNDSLQSIYEFPQVAGSPIYFTQTGYAEQFPGKAANVMGKAYSAGGYAQGNRPILPGSGEKPGLFNTGTERPVQFMRQRYVDNNVATTSLGYTFNSGDTAWMLTSCALVLFMTMPGLAIYYAGMVRDKNVLSCIMQVFVICCLITVWWMIFGYSLSFAPVYPNDHTQEIFGNWERLWLRGMTTRTFHFLAPTIPESVYCLFQLTFAIITAALMLGSFADRMKFVPMMIFVSIWHLVVYCPLAHSNWHMQGFMKNIGVLDYAGGNVVHICSGASGLATVLVIGNRKGFGKEHFDPHNILLTYMGMAMLWVGWFGFNGGSAVGANFNAGYAMLATHISTSVAALMWLATEWAVRGKPSVLGMISGAVAGLVCITPSSGYVDMTGAFLIGFFGGPLCYAGSQLKHFLGYDDALDAFGVHAIGGIIGGIATGFFATDQVNPFGAPSPFLFAWAKANNQKTGTSANTWHVSDGDMTGATDAAGAPTGVSGGTNYRYGPGYVACLGTYFNGGTGTCYVGPATPIKGVYYGNLQEGGFQLAAQICGILFAFGWAFGWTLLIAFLIDLCIGLRVSDEEEEEGLDSSIHGEAVGNMGGGHKGLN
jgi:Amt family ammonium transporter